MDKALRYEIAQVLDGHRKVAAEIRRLGKTPIVQGHGGQFDMEDFLTGATFPLVGFDDERGMVIIKQTNNGVTFDELVPATRVTITIAS